MRRSILPLAVLLGLTATASTSRAQFAGGFDDPFFLYYSYFVPQQAFFASIPRQEDVLRQMAVQRQFNAMTDRMGGGFDPGSTLSGYDPFAVFGEQNGSRLPKVSPVGVVNYNLQGGGIGGYHNRTGNYFPGMRTGSMGATARAPVSSLVPRFDSLGISRTQRRSFGMGGLPNMNMGLGGFR
jgi:hypothetical protein